MTTKITSVNGVTLEVMERNDTSGGLFMPVGCRLVVTDTEGKGVDLNLTEQDVDVLKTLL